QTNAAPIFGAHRHGKANGHAVDISSVEFVVFGVPNGKIDPIDLLNIFIFEIEPDAGEIWEVSEAYAAFFGRYTEALRKSRLGYCKTDRYCNCNPFSHSPRF